MIGNRWKIGILLYILLFLFDGNISYANETINETTANSLNVFTSVFSLTTFLNIIFAFIVFVVTFMLSKAIPKMISSRIERHIGEVGGNAEEMIAIVNRTLAVVIGIIGFSAGLNILGVDMTIFMGGIGFGIGFTLRVFLTNFITGIIIVTQGTYHNGDLIEINGKIGKIKKIYALYTAVEQFNGVIYFVPNVKFLEENVSNYYANSKRRVEVEVIVNYETDVYKAKNILIQVASQFPNILQTPQSDVLVDKLGENGVLLTLRSWINSEDNYITTKSNLTETVNLAFKKSGIEIPYKNLTITNLENMKK